MNLSRARRLSSTRSISAATKGAKEKTGVSLAATIANRNRGGKAAAQHVHSHNSKKVSSAMVITPSLLGRALLVIS